MALKCLFDVAAISVRRWQDRLAVKLRRLIDRESESGCNPAGAPACEDFAKSMLKRC